MAYNPDAWVVVKITTEKHGTVYKVLAGWYGGFSESDRWRMNSGIEKIKSLGNSEYELIGFSGSTYRVHLDTYRMTSLMYSVYNSFVYDIKVLNGTIEVLPIENFVYDLTRELE